jgi:hypothetical protein
MEAAQQPLAAVGAFCDCEAPRLKRHVRPLIRTTSKLDRHSAALCRYGGGMPRSLQIFLARSPLISVCRGTLDVLAVGLTKME